MWMFIVSLVSIAFAGSGGSMMLSGRVEPRPEVRFEALKSPTSATPEKRSYQLVMSGAPGLIAGVRARMGSGPERSGGKLTRRILASAFDNGPVQVVIESP